MGWGGCTPTPSYYILHNVQSCDTIEEEGGKGGVGRGRREGRGRGREGEKKARNRTGRGRCQDRWQRHGMGLKRRWGGQERDLEGRREMGTEEEGGGREWNMWEKVGRRKEAGEGEGEGEGGRRLGGGV